MAKLNDVQFTILINTCYLLLRNAPHDEISEEYLSYKKTYTLW